MVSSTHSDVEFTLEEISQVLNIPKETCRQVLLMALRKLSLPRNKEKLEDIADLLAMIEEK